MDEQAFLARMLRVIERADPSPPKDYGKHRVFIAREIMSRMVCRMTRRTSFQPHFAHRIYCRQVPGSGEAAAGS